MSLLRRPVYSSRTADKFVLRMPDGMRDQMAELAKNHNRSMNSEMITRLQKSLDEASGESKGVAGSPDTLWNPSLHCLVRTKDGIIGTITRFSEGCGKQDLLRAQLDNLHWHELADLKPVLITV